MGLTINWHTQQGTLTADNRDCCGIGLRDDAALCAVLDGSSSGANSGEFSRQIARRLIDWFLGAPDLTADTITARLCAIHEELSPKFRQDSASLVIALVARNGEALLLYEGDCLAGLRDGSSATMWHTEPHTLVNITGPIAIEEIAQSPLRNKITRSFRSKEFMGPDVSGLTVEVDQSLVLATDGFWAALDQTQQHRFLAREALSAATVQDDCSVLTLRFSDRGEDNVRSVTPENIYVRDARA